MQNDDITWSIINRHHCSYKIKTETQRFCRNEFNLTGLCNRRSCPLANSQYATVRESKGVVYLYIRHAEKVYTPVDQWMRVKLSKTFVTALQQVEDNLVFWPNFYKQKCRQRLLKITQYLARMRKMKLNTNKVLVPVRKKQERRLKRREEKALIAAKLDHAIEKQLLERLKQGTYERIYNFPKKAFEVHLDQEELEREDEALRDGERLEIEEEEEEEEEEREIEKEREQEEEMDDELRQELERGLIREKRAVDSDESDFSADEEYNEDDLHDDEDFDEEAEEREAEERLGNGKMEFVADFDESDDELEADIEDDPTGSKFTTDKRLLPMKPVKRKDNVWLKQGEEVEDQRQQAKYSDLYSKAKYSSGVFTKSESRRKWDLVKFKARRKIRAIYEKEQAIKYARKIKILK